MGIGPKVRRAFGPYELQAAIAFRRCFVNLDQLAESIHRLAPDARRIAEVGCGDGLFTNPVARAFPEARVVAVDIAPEPGRLFDGDRTRVEFRSEPVDTFVATSEQFDLVIVVDVVHHVAVAERVSFLQSVERLVGPRGLLVVKEWVRRRNVAHCSAYLFDRYVLGDRVSYLSLPELRTFLAELFGSDRVRIEGNVRPHVNNVMLSVRP